MTLRQAYRAYILDREKLSPSTLREYSRIAETSDSPLMGKKISDIRSGDLTREVKRLEKIYSPKSVRNRVGLFTAVMHEYAPEIPLHAKLPKKKNVEVYVPDEAVVVRLYNILLKRKSYVYLLRAFILASQCGLRASEISALFFDRINPETNRVHICAAMVQGIDGQHLKGPKSDAGDRWVPISQAALAVIGNGKPGERVVPLSAAYISTSWHRFITSTGEKPFSFHKLRHFFCSRALLVGVPKKYVAYFMGHSGEQMVDRIYEHVFPSARDAFADKLTETALFGPNATANATPLPEIP
jgi:integrase